MKKALLLIAIFIMSIFSVYAEDDVGTPAVIAAKPLAAKPVAAALRERIQEKLQNVGTVDDCVRRAKEAFPDTDAGRIRGECAELVRMKERVQTARAAFTAVSADMRVCYDYLKKNTDAENPAEKCAEIAKDNGKCVEFLEEKGIEEAENKCQRLFQAGAQIIKDRTYIKAAITNKVSEARLKVIDRLKENYPEVKDFIGKLDDENAEKFLKLDRERQKEILKEGVAKAAQAMKKLSVKKITKAVFQKREIVKENYQKAKENYQAAKEKYALAKNKFSGEKKSFNDAVASGDEEAAIEHGKEMLLDVGNMVLESLNKIKEQVNSNDDLSEEEAASILEDIDDKIEEIESAMDAVEAAETKDEVKEAGKAIISAWNRIKFRLRYHAAYIVRAAAREILERSEHLEARLNNALAKLEEQGYDTSEVQDLVDEFSAKIDEARDLFIEAQDLFQEAKETSDSTLVQEARGKVKSAHEKLKEANLIVRDIVKKLKEINGGADPLEAEEEYEVVDEEQAAILLESDNTTSTNSTNEGDTDDA